MRIAQIILSAFCGGQAVWTSLIAIRKDSPNDRAYAAGFAALAIFIALL